MHALVIEPASEFVSPQTVFEALPKGARFLLESTLVNTENRWAILGYSSASVFYSKDGKSWLDNKEQVGNPFEILAGLIAKTHSVLKGNYSLPFLGGWLGCVSYEAARFLENVPTHESDFDFDLAFYLVDSFYVFDLVEKKIYCVSSSGKVPELKDTLRKKGTLRGVSPFSSSITKKGTPHGVSPFSGPFSSYLQSIERIQNYIRDGHTYQVNLSQRFCLDNNAEPFEIYKALSHISPVPFAGFFEWNGCAVISGSPERLFEIRERTIRTRPIAGTRRCGSPEETERFIEELKRDPKEHAEHAMLVDLARNDLGRICKHGSVFVSQYMDIVSYTTVIHTESEVQGTLLDGISFLDVMRALFPGGTITGVPKIRTMEIIHELEPCARGIYTGAFGYWSACGHSDFNIMIRPIICKQGKAYTHAGGGITCMCIPNMEYKETLHKARAQLSAILQTNSV